MCGEISLRSRPAAAARRSTVQALCRDSRPPRAFRNSACVPRPLRDEIRPPTHLVRRQRVAGVGADRYDALLAALAAQQHRTGLQVDVVDVQPDCLRDARTRPVQELQQRSVPSSQYCGLRLSAGRRSKDPGHLVDGQGLRQPLRRCRRLHRCRRVDRGQPLPQDRTCGSPRTATTVRPALDAVSGGWSASPSRNRIRKSPTTASEIRPRSSISAPGQVAVVPAQVAPVRRQGVGGQAALDRQVVEVRTDRPADLPAQTRTSSSFSWARSCASATGP